MAVAFAMWRLARTYGGVDIRDAVAALAPMLAAIPAAAIGLSTLNRRAGLVVAAIGIGIALSAATASYRADMVAPVLAYSAMVITGLATVAIWRRPWGPKAIAAIALVVGVRVWWVGLEVWYGSSLSASSVDRWMALPWHNQSGVLMAAVAVAFGVAATGERWRLAFGAMSGLAAAAVVLSGSRGSLVALGVGVVAAIVAQPRSWRRWALIGAASVMAFVVLTHLPGAAMSEGGDSQPAAESSSARVAHWKAASAMFVDSPLTGSGVGSYRLASARWADGAVNPSSYAHNEYIEFFAEGGVALGVPFALALIAIAIAAITALRRPQAGLRSRVAMGAAAVWLALAVHAGADFDWLFPILAMAFAIAAGVVVGSDEPRQGTRWMVVPVAALLVIALGAGYLEGRPGTGGVVHAAWNLEAASSIAERTIDAGDYERAQSIIDRAEAWNPGDPGLRMLDAVVGLRTGTGDAGDVVTAAERAGFGVRLDAATQLSASGHFEEAQVVVARTIERFDDYPGWNLGGVAAVAYRLHVDLAGRIDGCEGARLAADEATSTPLAMAMGTENYTAQAAPFCGQ